MDKDQEKGMNRREFIRKAAITGAVAWAVPAIQTVSATPAFAQTACSPACYHSPAGGTPNCTTICQAKCPPGTTGQGNACNDICNSCPPCPTNDRCPPCYCNPASFTGSGSPGSACQITFNCV